MKLLQPPAGAAPIASLPYGVLASAFVGARVDGRRGIWYAFARNGHGPTYLFPVLESGEVSCHGGTVFAPQAEMPIYEPATLGIIELVWTEDKLE